MLDSCTVFGTTQTQAFHTRLSAACITTKPIACSMCLIMMIARLTTTFQSSKTKRTFSAFFPWLFFSKLAPQLHQWLATDYKSNGNRVCALELIKFLVIIEHVVLVCTYNSSVPWLSSDDFLLIALHLCPTKITKFKAFCPLYKVFKSMHEHNNRLKRRRVSA